MSDITLRDWQHASRLFLTENYKFSPKTKFLYHVSFYLSSNAKDMLPGLQNEINVLGMLAKTAELPQYTAHSQTLNKYNRKKVVQTHIEYKPIAIVLHDDTYGLTRHMLEGYYRYNFADGAHQWNSGAYGNPERRDTTYQGSHMNSYRFGLDNDLKTPFFNRIEISQLSHGNYFMYTLINPVILDWGHDSLAYSEGAGTTENRLSVSYEGVNYSQGEISGHAPTNFGLPDHYDDYVG